MNNLLAQLDTFLAKSSALHQHDEFGMHSIEKKHRIMRRAKDIYNLHKDNLPHLHDSDKKLVNFVKQSLALKAHNKPYWKSRGDKLLNHIQSWHDLMDKYGGHSMFIESETRKLQKETGFDLPDLLANVKKAKRFQKEKNYQMAAKHIMESKSQLHKFINEHFA